MVGASRRPNPFGSQFTRPGALPYLLADGRPIAVARRQLVDQVSAHWRSAVVGGHGTGKTTLVGEIEPELRERFSGALSRMRLRIGEPHAPLWEALAQTPRDGLLIIDGYDLLGLPSQWVLVLRARMRRVRLLATAHPTRLRDSPWLFRRIASTDPTEPVARTLLAMLLEDYPEAREAMLAAFEKHWPAHRENLRELWATMYDAYEAHLESS